MYSNSNVLAVTGS